MAMKTKGEGLRLGLGAPVDTPYTAQSAQ